MSTTGTSAIGAANNAGSTTNLPATPQRTLGQDAFLKLLITQLENQDPTQPKDDTEFIAQLATFTQLEKLTEIAASIKTLNENLTKSTPSGTDAAGSTNKTQPAPGA